MVGLAGDCYAVDTTAGSSCAKVRRHEQSVRARSLDFQEAIVPARRSSGEESGAMVHNSGAYSWGNMPSLLILPAKTMIAKQRLAEALHGIVNAYLDTMTV